MSQQRRRAQLCTLLFTAGTALGGSAGHSATIFSQDNAQVDLYGILDAGIGYLEHSWPGSDVFASTVNPYNLNASPHSFTGIYTGGISMSRVGLRGEAQFGGGRKAFFRLETAVNVTTGVLSNNGQSIYNNTHGLKTANAASAIDGQWDSRCAYLGVSDPAFGSLQVGRTINLSFDQVVEYDPVQAALLYSPLGFSGGIGGGLGATENSRLDSSLKYENKIGGVSLGAQYKVAGDKNSQGAGYGWVAMLGYGAGRFSFKGTFSEQTNTVTWPVQYSNVVPPAANVQVENTRGYMMTGLYKLADAVTLKAGYENLTVSAPSNSNLTGIQDYFGIILPRPAVNASGQQRFWLWWAGGDYHLTRDLDVGVGFYDIDTYNQPEVGKDYLANAYSLLADYSFSSRFDGYLGVMLMHYSGPGLINHAPIDAYSSNGLYGVGVRFKF
jgi:general bacterial porin, GBP family